MELRNPHFRVPTSSCQGEGNMGSRVTGEWLHNAAESKNLSMRGNFKRENREIPRASLSTGEERSEKASGRTSGMHTRGKSDDSIVPAKRANKTKTLAAEFVEERGSPKGNTVQKASPRTQRHNGGWIAWTVYGKYGECEFTRPSYPREEPYEVVLHVRICAGGGPKGPFLPRFSLLGNRGN